MSSRRRTGRSSPLRTRSVDFAAGSSASAPQAIATAIRPTQRGIRLTRMGILPHSVGEGDRGRNVSQRTNRQARFPLFETTAGLDDILELFQFFTHRLER